MINVQSVRIETLPTEEITPQAWNEMWALTQDFYETDRLHVEAQLKRHLRTVFFRTRGEGRLIGMASVDVDDVLFEGQRIVVISTSHVLLHEEYRGHNLIQRVGFQTFIRARLRHPLRPIYWFFDSFSVKSYLLLPRNFTEYWPRFDQPTPNWARALMNQLALRAYGSDWQPEQGIVVRSGRKRLRAEVAPLVPKPGAAPELEFFARANPGHAQGDMLVCLCPLTARNWLSVARQALRRARRTSAKA